MIDNVEKTILGEPSEYILHTKQWLALCRAMVVAVMIYLGGIRSGKTITGAHFALRMILDRPDEVGGIFSNTNKQLTKATLKEFKKVLASYGLYENRDYVVNKNPEKLFGYRSMFAHHEGVWSFWNGAQVYCFSLETAIRGVEFGWVWGDEIQDAKKEDLDVVTGRMSGSRRGARTLYTMTPPKNNPDVEEIVYGEDGEPRENVVRGTTYDNARHLPAGYIEGLEKTFDDITLRREVKAERVALSGFNWLYSFDKKKHVSTIAQKQDDQPVYLSFDFNVNPFVCILSHRGIREKEVDGVKTYVRYIHYFATAEITPDMIKGTEWTFVEALLEKIKQKTPTQAKLNLYKITGDATGRAQHVTLRAGENVWTQIRKHLHISDANFHVKNSNPVPIDSRELCNSMFAKYDEILINPECKKLIRDCENVQANPDGSKKKDNRQKENEQADYMDALSYDINAFNGNWFSILRKTA